MTNFSAKILNNSVGALAAQQAVIAATANNISNVNTPGYVRRTVELQTRVSEGRAGTVEVGNGVEVASVKRLVDNFLEQQLREAGGDKENFGLQADFLTRADKLFGLTDSLDNIGSTYRNFSSASQDLALNPADIQLRQNFIDPANDLTNSLRSTFGQLADLQTEANTRIGAEIQTVNTITGQIADLNGIISSREGTGQTAADERDRRDQLLQDLGKKLSFNYVEQSDGTVQITLANGFPLVTGTTSRNLDFNAAPSFAATPPPSLEGGRLGYITFDYNPGAGTSDINLTQTIAAGSGSIAGLLAVRGYNAPTATSSFEADGPIVAMASRVEAFTRQLLVDLNQTYYGPDRDAGTAGVQSSAGDLDGNNPAVFGLFNVSFGGALDADGDGLAELSDLTATGYDNFTSRLQVSITNPRNVAAARDASGGPPAAAVYPTGDGSNMSAVAARSTATLTFSVGTYSFTGTFEGRYNETIGYLSNQATRAKSNESIANSKFVSAQAQRDEVSAVSLDEEFTQLIRFQKAYQASARLIRVADELLEQLVNII